MTVEEKLKALAKNPHAGPPWTVEDQAHHIATFKADLAELLKGGLVEDGYFMERGRNLALLATCLDALRNELIAWCEGKS